MDENKVFMRVLEDKFQRFKDYYILMSSDFLSMEQQSAAAGFLRAHRGEGVFLYGGYGDAERRQVVFMPDYTGVRTEEEAESYFRENPEDCPLVLLDVKVAASDKGRLSHRDYLGALTGEGIKREKVGDIIVSPEGAQIVVAREMAPYLEQNYRQAGNVPLQVKTAPIFEINVAEIKTKLEKFTVSSPRVDNIISAAFQISRKDAVEAVSRGKVFVSGAEMSKPDYTLRGGEKVVLRGKGKIIYKGECGTSRKGKIYIEVVKYV